MQADDDVVSMTDADFDNAMDGLLWSPASSFQSGAAEEETPSTLRQRIGGTRHDRRAAKSEQKAERKASKLERKAAAPTGLAASAREIFNAVNSAGVVNSAANLLGAMKGDGETPTAKLLRDAAGVVGGLNANDRAVALFDDASRLVNRCDRLLRGVAQLIVLLLLSLGAWLLVVGAVPGPRIVGGALLAIAACAVAQVASFSA